MVSIFAGSFYETFIKAASIEFARARTFFQDVLVNAIPGDAVDLLPEWVDIYQIDSTLSTADKQALALGFFTTRGNQELSYIQDRFDDAGLAAVTVGESQGSECQCGLAETGVTECGGSGAYMTLAGSVSAAEEIQALVLAEYYRPAQVPVINNL